LEVLTTPVCFPTASCHGTPSDKEEGLGGEESLIGLLSRETEAVRLLALHRFLTRPQLEALLLSESTHTPRSRQVVTWRLLARLQRRGLVAATPRQTGGPVAGSTLPGYFLTAGGLRLAATCYPDLPARRPARRAPFLFAHSVLATEVELAFRRAAAAHEDHGLELWEAEWQLALRLGKSAVVPDARLVYRFGRRRLHLFVEADLGTEGTRFFARKMTRYLDLYRSGAWRAFMRIWPLILAVTLTEARAASLHAATDAALPMSFGVAPLSVYFCSIESLGRDGLATACRVVGENDALPLLRREEIQQPVGAECGSTSASGLDSPAGQPPVREGHDASHLYNRIAQGRHEA